MRVVVEPEITAYHHRWQSSDVRPACLIGEDLSLLWRNAAFAALDKGGPLREHEQTLQFSDRTLQAAFATFLTGLGSGPSAWLLSDDERGVLLLRCLRVQPEGLAPAVACVLHDSSNRAAVVWADFGAAFALTAAEATLARRLAEGELLADVAEAVSITYETAKTHLRRIYAKLGVRGREEFYARMLAFRVV